MFPHGMVGIGAEIHHDLVNLGWIGKHRSAVGIDLLADFDGGGQRGPQQLEDLLDNGLDLQRFSFQIGAPAEGKDLLDQFLGAVGGREYVAQKKLALTVRGQFMAGHLRKTNERGQDIIKIMGNTPGQGADGLHLLGLAELRFKDIFFVLYPAPLADILHRTHHAQGLPPRAAGKINLCLLMNDAFGPVR